MASGNTMAVFTALHSIPPTTNYATLDERNAHPVLDFDAATDEDAIFSGVLPNNYAGSGLTVTLVWCGDGVTAGNVVWNAAFERIDDEGLDIDSDSFASVQTATGAAPGTDGQAQYTSITFSNGAEIDSLAVGEAFRLKVTRDANHASDTMAADAQLLRVIVKET